MSATGEAPADAGFTLLETLVAFLIVALALQAILVFSGRMIAEQDAARKQLVAARVLQNALDGLEVQPGLVPGEHYWTEAGDYNVRVHMRPDTLGERQGGAERIRLIVVDVRVEWEGRQERGGMGASTLRLQTVMP